MPTVDHASVEASSVQLKGSAGARDAKESGISGSGEKFGDVLHKQSAVKETADSQEEVEFDASQNGNQDGNSLQPSGNNLPDDTKLVEQTEARPANLFLSESIQAEVAVEIRTDTKVEQGLVNLIPDSSKAVGAQLPASNLGGSKFVDRIELTANKGALDAAGVLKNESLKQSLTTLTSRGRTSETVLKGGALINEGDIAVGDFGDAFDVSELKSEIGEQLRNLQQTLALNKAALSNPQSIDAPLKPAAVSELAGQASTSALGLTAGVDSGSGLGAKASGTGSLMSGTLFTPVTSNSWGGEFSSRVTFFTKQGIQEANLQLTPPDLGRLEIKISTDGDQTKMLFTVQSSAAREAIELAMPRLREMLEQGGLQLAHSEVADQSQSQQRNDSFAAGFVSQSFAGEEMPAEQEVEGLSMNVSNSLVDYYI